MLTAKKVFRIFLQKSCFFGLLDVPLHMKDEITG